jgi:flagellar basal-body rod modification protein FlgD
MGTIDGITGVSDASALQQTNSTTYGGQDLGKDAFMSLLTTQMQNQDPLDPMKNDEFVAQLAQFSSLEQLMGMQGTMQSVAMGISSLNNASMANLVGTDVVAIGDTFHYEGEGSKDLHYAFDEPVTNAQIVISDENGDTVQTIEIKTDVATGDQITSWDGKGLSGEQLPEGDYTFKVTGDNADGVEVSATTTIHGTVTEMDYSSGTPQPSVDGTVVSLADLLKLTAGSDDDTAATEETVEETGFEEAS